jgi:hypothetical protein
MTSLNGDNHSKCSDILSSSMLSNGHSKSPEKSLSEGETVAENVRALQSIFDHSKSNLKNNFEDTFQLNEQFNPNREFISFFTFLFPN